MTYQLGIDLGTTYTAASIGRSGDRTPEVVTLGTRSATVASVMYLADDGSVLVGDAAERRALTDPDRVVREFKRRIGDEIPLLIGGRQYQAHELGARMTRWVVDLVAEREGGMPRRMAVTHPAAWGAHKKDLLTRALRDVGLNATFLAEPQAAAVSYASAERVDVGSTIAVYDLGGGTFDAAVVRKTASGGFELLGQPEGLERLGGVDFDEAVFNHVRESLGGQLDGLDPEDPDVLTAVARLRRECVEAKEALSSDTEATIPVLLPNLRSQSRITRGEFEAMIRPALEETILALRRAIGSAGLTPAGLSAVLLVGGSSRIPLVSQLVSDELGRPVAVDADPKTAIAMGAALAISPQPAPAPSRPAPAGGGISPGAAGVGAAGAIGGAAFRSGPSPAAVSSPAAPPPTADLGYGGSPRVPPRRPPIGGEPPRPEVAPAAFADGGHAGYDESGRRRQTMLIGVGGLVAIGAIIAVILLWSSHSADTTGASNNSDLTPATTAPATTAAPEPTRHTSAPVCPRTTPPTLRSTTVNHPPSTVTKEPAPSSQPSRSSTRTPSNRPGEDDGSNQTGNQPNQNNSQNGNQTGSQNGTDGQQSPNGLQNGPQSGTSAGNNAANSGYADPNSFPGYSSNSGADPGTSSNRGTAATPQASVSSMQTPPNEFDNVAPSPNAGGTASAPSMSPSWFRAPIGPAHAEPA